MTDGQPKFVIDMIYESEHDPRSWINNLSGSKRTWKNFRRTLTSAVTRRIALSIKASQANWTADRHEFVVESYFEPRIKMLSG